MRGRRDGGKLKREKQDEIRDGVEMEMEECMKKGW